MSLFDAALEGDSTMKIKHNALFDEESTPARNSSPGIFSDEVTVTDSSPWEFPTPRKGGRGDLIKKLLPGDDVPESYVDAFDALLADSEGVGGRVSVNGAKEVINRSNLAGGACSTIRSLVIRDKGDSDGLERGEFNVLLALIGLAQEGEDITLDGVDERRRNLPEPKLEDLKPAKSTADADGSGSPPTSGTQEQPSTPQATSRPQPQPSPSPAMSRGIRKQSFGFPETDPWASPAAQRNLEPQSNTAATQPNGLTNGSSMPGRTTSTFTTASGQASSNAASNEGGVGGDDGWASENNFDGPGGFGGPPSGTGGGGGNDPAGLGRALGGGRVATGVPEEVITITAMPEKEGTFLFQHHNYQVTSARRNSKVIRRYSDFVWLLDCLHKRYPFRQLPLLPPKRVAINGNYLAADGSFLEKRRRGLARFANALVRHPVLSQEQLVVMFLTVPTELAVWRRQAAISVQEEFTGKELPAGLEDSLPPNLQDLFDTVRSGVRRSTEIYISLCNMTERLAKRNEGMAADLRRFSGSLQSLTEASKDTYAADTNDVPLLNEGLNAAAKHFSTSEALLEDEARAWEATTLEDLKRQRDCLVSVRDMFDRRDRYAKDNIPQLERRIENNETKLAAIRAKPEGQQRPGEAEKLEEAIFRDKQSIVSQHARGVFIKECIRDELLFFQQSQYHVSRLHQDWSQERVKYAELQADNWKALSEEIETMPLGD